MCTYFRFVSYVHIDIDTCIRIYHRIPLDIISSIIIVTIDRTLPMRCEGLLSAEMSVPHRRWLCHSTVIDRFRWDCSRQFR